MSTVRTCTTPKDGWALYSHLLGNLLLVIQLQVEGRGKDSKDGREQAIFDTWAQLVGNLYVVMRRMELNAHGDTAAKMQQIIDMVVEQDLTNPDVETIHAKYDELSMDAEEFEKALEKARAERAAQA